MTQTWTQRPATNTRRRAALCSALLVLALALPAAADTVYLELSSSGLEDLGSSWVYEGWLIVDGTAVSTGIFSIVNGMASPSRFAVAVDNAAAATTFVLTIEPVADSDPAPSEVHVLAGDLAGGIATLTAAHPAALGSDFLNATGSYILNAPSGGAEADYSNGIWWLDPASGPGATFDLPMLPAGWRYEGWVVGPDGPISTGRFTDVAAADSDGPGITGGPFAAPPFPGQDLVVPPTDLTSGYAAVLSIEPEPDNMPGPFIFKPLVDTSIDDVGAGVLQAMVNNAGTFPTATVTVAEAPATAETAHLMLDFTGLDNLGPDFAYEGWLIVDGTAISTGVFTVDGGVPSAHYFPTEVPSLDALSAFVLTIEPVPDGDPAPSSVHLLAGDLTAGRAVLSVDHPAALGTDFSSATGSYILNAPSGGEAADFRNGIWWLDPDAGPGATLVLPQLPHGWVYEGWVVGAEGPVSTGRFSSADGADSDGPGPQGGESASPPFPGQDFVNPASDLTAGYAAVLSVEPEPDSSPSPFTLKPLLDPVIDDVGAGILQPMHRNTVALPAGTAVLARTMTIPAAASTAGIGGAQWFTDIDVANDSSRSAVVLLQLLRSNQTNPAPETVTFDLAAGSAMRYRDVLADLFGFSGTGALRVLANNHEVRVSSRTYAASAVGTYGQGIPSHGEDRLLRYPDVGRLLQLAENDSFRTNIGFVNAGSLPVGVELELYAADGRLVRTRHLTLQAWEHRQLNGAFQETVDVGWARVGITTSGGGIFAYASVADNGADDPTFILVE